MYGSRSFPLVSLTDEGLHAFFWVGGVLVLSSSRERTPVGVDGDTPKSFSRIWPSNTSLPPFLPPVDFISCPPTPAPVLGCAFLRFLPVRPHLIEDHPWRRIVETNRLRPWTVSDGSRNVGLVRTLSPLEVSLPTLSSTGLAYYGLSLPLPGVVARRLTPGYTLLFCWWDLRGSTVEVVSLRLLFLKRWLVCDRESAGLGLCRSRPEVPSVTEFAVIVTPWSFDGSGA